MGMWSKRSLPDESILSNRGGQKHGLISRRDRRKLVFFDGPLSRSRGGNRTMLPIKTAVSEAINTAPLPTSKASRIHGSSSRVTARLKDSRPVLNNSRASTQPILPTSTHHCQSSIRNQTERSKTRTATGRCTLKLLCVLKPIATPRKATLNFLTQPGFE